VSLHTVADREHAGCMKSLFVDIPLVRSVRGVGIEMVQAASEGLDVKDHYLARLDLKHDTLSSQTS